MSEKLIKILFRTEENGNVYGFVPEYGLTVMGCCKDNVTAKIEKVLDHLVKKAVFGL